MVRQTRRRYPSQVPLVGALSRTVSGRPVFPENSALDRGALQVEAARLVAELFPDNPIARTYHATAAASSVVSRLPRSEQERWPLLTNGRTRFPCIPCPLGSSRSFY